MSETVKQEAARLVEGLPDDATWEDLMYEVYVRHEIEAGLADLDAGGAVSSDEIRRHFNLPK